MAFNLIHKKIRSLFRTVFSTTPPHPQHLSENLKVRLQELTADPIKNELLFKIALTHRSAIDFIQKKDFVSNERLEFLGDAVLDLVVAERLYTQYPHFDEGSLTKLRSQIVNAKSLAYYANQIRLGELIIVSEAAEQNGVRESETSLADALEALIGAVYLDSGYNSAKSFLERHILSSTDFEFLLDTDQNYKSALLELAQAQRLQLPNYIVLNEEGPSHKRIFTVGVKVGDQLLGQGSGKSKKSAEQLAAREAYERMKSLPQLTKESLVLLAKQV